jgi:cyclase
MKEWSTGTTELAPGVFAYVQATGAFCIANAGIIAGRDATTAIDALFTPRMTHALLDEAQRVAPKPIAGLINTHHHVDHTMGNALFPSDTEIVAHAKAKGAWSACAAADHRGDQANGAVLRARAARHRGAPAERHV